MANTRPQPRHQFLKAGIRFAHLIELPGLFLLLPKVQLQLLVCAHGGVELLLKVDQLRLPFANTAERHVVSWFQCRKISEESLGGYLRRCRRHKSTLRGRSFQPFRHLVKTELLPIHPRWIRPVLEYTSI